jgi:predicted nucleic acid-binding protein
VSVVTSYELYTGVEKCVNPLKERAKVELFLATISEMAFECAEARKAAELRAWLEARGKMIGPYDVLLAGQALIAGLVLVTNKARLTELLARNANDTLTTAEQTELDRLPMKAALWPCRHSLSPLIRCTFSALGAEEKRSVPFRTSISRNPVWC